MYKTVASILLLVFSITIKPSEPPVKELIGKGDPILYGDGYSLRKEAHEAFMAMRDKAREDGIEISVVSSYRSFAHQKRIWERKYNNYIAQGLAPVEAIQKIVEYSTIPGTSRHHWGTDIDIIDANVARPTAVLLEKHFNEGGVYHALKLWLDEHASSFGFCLVYTNRKDRKGFKYEPWHFSYKPLSYHYLKSYLNVDIAGLLNSEQLPGSAYFSPEFIAQYTNEHLLDINSDLK